METQLATKDYSFNQSNQIVLEKEKVGYTREPVAGTGKKSFLVFNRNKYLVVPTDAIAFFYIKFDATVFVTFDKREYTVNYSLEQVQQLLPGQQFFRLSRQYLLNFNAVKEVEHYFARKLLVVPTVSFSDKLVVSKEKAKSFLDWLENR